MNDNVYYTLEESEQYTFYRVPKILIEDEVFSGVSMLSKMLYGLMLDRMGLSKSNGWVDDEGRVYIRYTIAAIMQDFNCGKNTAVKIKKELVDIGLIEDVKTGGIGNSSVIYVCNFTKIAQNLKAFKTESLECKPRKFENQTPKVYISNPESLEYKPRKFENQTPKVYISNSNNNNLNNNNLNNTDDNENDLKGIDSVTDTFDLQAIVDTYHRLCPTLPKVDLSDQSFNAHWSGIIKVTCLQLKHEGKYPEDSTELDIMADIFIRVGQSDYLTGRTGKWTGCTFHWIITAIHASDIAIGRYDTYRRPQEGGTTYERNETGADGTTRAEFSSTDFTNSALERFRQIKAQQSAV